LLILVLAFTLRANQVLNSIRRAPFCLRTSVRSVLHRGDHYQGFSRQVFLIHRE
jgi:hypothetical protein